MRDLVEDFRSLSSPQHIVVASDLSDKDKLLPHAIAQSKTCQATVTLVHVVAVSEAAACESEAANILGGMANQIRDEGIRCEVVVRRGNPATVVQDVVAETGATRLLVGTHRHGQCGPLLLGTVANALLLAARIPVFAVGPGVSREALATPRRILHPVSLRGEYRETAEFALQLAEVQGAELTFVHILDTSVMAGDYVEEIFAKAKRELAALLPTASISPVHVLAKAGDVTLELLELSRNEKIDWIVMGIERYFPWWSKRNNHVYRVIAEAPCPVLAVRSRYLASSIPFAETEEEQAVVSSL